MEDLPTLIVTLGQLAAVFGVDKRRIGQLVKQGVIQKETRGQYELIGACASYIDYLRKRDGEVNLAIEDDPRAATVRLKTAQAIKFELDNAVRQKELLEQAETLQFLEEIAVAYTMALEAFEGRLVGALVEATGAEQQTIADAIAREVHAARTQTADALRMLADKLAAGATDNAAAA